MTSTVYHSTFWAFLVGFILMFACCLSPINAQVDGQLLADDSNPISEKELDAAANNENSNNSSTFFIHQDGSLKAPQRGKKASIEHKYYANNIFDIDESDNPFALLNEHHQQKHLAEAAQKKPLDEQLKTLFVTKDSAGVPSWLVLVLLGILSFMAVILSTFPNYVKNTFQAFGNATSAGNVYREQQAGVSLGGLATQGLFALSMGSFLFLITPHFVANWGLETFAMLSLMVLGVGSIYFAKHMQLRLVGWLLPYEQEISYYSFLIANQNKVLGFALIPLLFLLAFAPDTMQTLTVYLSLSLLAISYLYRSFRTLTTVSDLVLFHKFHFFMYLCTVEIAPIVILLKLLSIL